MLLFNFFQHRSHVPFAHHGIQGNRDRAMPIPLKILRSTIVAEKPET